VVDETVVDGAVVDLVVDLLVDGADGGTYLAAASYTLPYTSTLGMVGIEYDEVDEEAVVEDTVDDEAELVLLVVDFSVLLVLMLMLLGSNVGSLMSSNIDMKLSRNETSLFSALVLVLQTPHVRGPLI
jgi:hypothetical protein